MNLKMNSGWKKELDKAVQSTMKGVARDYQKVFDALSRRYRGRPVSEIKPVLRREWSRVGGSISDPELSLYAKYISEGTRVKIEIG